MKLKVACLPVASLDNPYQRLMIEGLNSDSRIDAISGIDDRLFGIFRTGFYLKPNFIHFDWITSYYHRKNLWFTILNVPLFVIQLIIVKYVLNIKLVWTLHNIHPHDNEHQRIHAFCSRVFASQMSWIRLFSEDTLHRAQEALKIERKFIICPEGSFVNYYQNKSSIDESRKILNIKKNDFVYLYLGFIKPYKGIEDLITNFKKLNIANKKLLIAGKIFNESYFQKIFSSDENILFVNKFIKNDELQYFFKSANVIVLPFKKVENSGSAILAMGFKKVVIAPKIGVLQHRLKNQKNYLFEEGDLLSKLQLSFDNQDSLDEYGQLNFLELEKHNWFDFSKYFI